MLLKGDEIKLCDFGVPQFTEGHLKRATNADLNVGTILIRTHPFKANYSQPSMKSRRQCGPIKTSPTRRSYKITNAGAFQTSKPFQLLKSSQITGMALIVRRMRSSL
ncbi:hypothetical protein CLAIMM_12103, partial [Cladophialophora immunda]